MFYDEKASYSGITDRTCSSNANWTSHDSKQCEQKLETHYNFVFDGLSAKSTSTVYEDKPIAGNSCRQIMLSLEQAGVLKVYNFNHDGCRATGGVSYACGFCNCTNYFNAITKITGIKKSCSQAGENTSAIEIIHHTIP